MKRIIAIFMTLAMITSLFSMVDVSAVTNQKYLVDLIEEGVAIIDNSDGKTYTPYQCDSAVDVGVPAGVVRIGDGTATGYVDYSHGFRYHASSQGTARTITFTMPEGYNTLSGVVGVCTHVPGPDSGKDVYYREECYLAINVDGYPVYNSGFIKSKTGYSFKLRAKAGSKVDISVINLAENNSHCHVIFGDPKLTHEDYPDIDLSFDKAVYRVGDTVLPVVTGEESDDYTIEWRLDDEKIDGVTDSYTIKEADLGKTLKIVACDSEGVLITSAERFLSKLTVVSIETETGEDVTSKEDYIDADLKIYGNEEFDGEIQYDNVTEIRGRGNTSWTNHPKKSYKLKLDKKTNLCGMGKNKHWTLIACYWDECFLRNKMSYDLAGEMGLNYASSVWVDVYLNGKYHGMYLLCEHIRVDDTRVDIYDWEGTAEDVAEAIYDANPDKISDDGDFADYMNENMSWITSGEVTYEGNTYKVSDYFEDEIPDIDGGYLLELDTHRDEVSSVQTYSGLNINIKNPEFCITNTEMTNYVDTYLQAVEDACISKDYTTTYNGKTVRYTDLCDLDSMVKWWMVNEVFFNWDAGFNSNFMYKDHGTKLMFGPVWDMDITAGGYDTSILYDQWQTWFYKRNQCMNLWFKEAVADPVFLNYAHEVYWQYRDKFEEMIAEDGYMEKSHDLLYESGLKNTELWRWRKGYEADYQIMKEWLKNRLDWLDEQFATEESLIASMAAQTSGDGVTSYSSIEAYQNSAQMSVSFSTKSGAAFLKDETNAAAKYAVQIPDTLVNSVAITNNQIATVKREINGNNPVSVNVANGVAKFEDIKDDALDNGGQKSVILYTGYSVSGDVLGKTYVTVDPVKCTHEGTATQQIPEKAPTCTEDGYTAGVKCSHCGMTISGLEKQPATGHVGDTVCSVCGVTIGGEITPNPDFNDSISLESVNSCKDPAIKMTFKIPEGQSGIKGIYFMILPTENAPAGMEPTNITSPLTEKGWNFEFDTQRYLIGIVAGENARPLEEIATPDANGNYHLGTSILKVSNTVTSGKFTVNLLLANVITDSGNNEINYTKSLDINYDFSHKLEVIPEVKATCTSVGYTAGSKCTVCKKVIVEPKQTGIAPHQEIVFAAKAPTCTSWGITEGKQCIVCNTVTVAQKTLSKLPHNSRTILPAKAATYTSTGLTEGKKCSMCGTLILAQRVTPKLERKSLKKAKFTLKAKAYTGKALTQSFKVKLGSKTLKNKVDYTISYKNNKNIGKATVTIKGIGAYKGSVSKTFKINPKKVSSLKVKAGKKQLTISWKKDSKVGGYEIVYATSKNFKSGKKTVKITKASTAKKVISKLKSKKTYYVKVRAFKKVGKTTYYGAYTSAKSIKVK